ncbi:hypothetical protein B296_00040351 [Ensete ventricosum]|uniref:Uncharacterized protein n=1 Tax=Ensete ventricosum TaxID=4639 RepID=A0A426ZKZ6_ENSVE|nr:hypothetical protein B296_00040351 [Ensete ventricosum]
MGSRTSMVSRKNTTVINLCKVAREVEFRSVFRAPSRKFKILAIHNILANGKSYEHGFTKNATVLNFAQSRASGRVLIGFSCIVSEIQNPGLSQRISPWEVI